MKVQVGSKLKPRPHIAEWDDSHAEVVRFDAKTDKYHVVVDDNFGCWYDANDLDKDFSLIEF